MNGRREQLLHAWALDERLAQLAEALDELVSDPGVGVRGSGLAPAATGRPDQDQQQQPIPPPVADAALEAEFEQTRDAATKAGDAYATSLSPQPVSRCPYTGALLEWTIDTDGLDGPWWNRDAPLRPCEHLLPTLHSLTGAVRLTAPVEDAPFVCAPGPEAPWVAPEILAQPGVRAVLSCLPIGAHTAYLIAYYVEHGCCASGGLADWGIAHQLRRDAAGEEHYRLPEPADPGRDFELATWIAAGKLLWIAPGDAGWRLRATLAGCPYLALPGRHEPVLLLRGRVWQGTRIVEDEPA